MYLKKQRYFLKEAKSGKPKHQESHTTTKNTHQNIKTHTSAKHSGKNTMHQTQPHSEILEKMKQKAQPENQKRYSETLGRREPLPLTSRVWKYCLFGVIVVWCSCLFWFCFFLVLFVFLWFSEHCVFLVVLFCFWLVFFLMFIVILFFFFFFLSFWVRHTKDKSMGDARGDSLGALRGLFLY